MSWEANERGGGSSAFYIGKPAAPLPGGCLAYRPATGRRVPAARLPGGSLLPGAKMRLKINFIYIEVRTARHEASRGPAAPQPGGRGINL